VHHASNSRVGQRSDNRAKRRVIDAQRVQKNVGFQVKTTVQN